MAKARTNGSCKPPSPGFSEARPNDWTEARERQLKLKRQSWQVIVGNTIFLEARNLAPVLGCERVYLKFEGSNPTGTQKDRIAMLLADQAVTSGLEGITAATCGNFGVAVAYAARHYDIAANIYIPKKYEVPKDRLKRMESFGAKVHFVDGYYEDAVTYSSQQAIDQHWYDANPGLYEVTEISLAAYGEIANEIYRDLRRVPNYIFCPVGNGTTLVGIYAGFNKLYLSGKTMSVPKIVATSTRRGNPIIKSFKENKRTIVDLKPEEIRESKVNEPLTNWHSFDGQLGLDAIHESGGFAEYASDTKMMEFSKLIRSEEGLSVLPAAASTLAVMQTLGKEGFIVKGTFVAVLTARDFD
ncbi:MAG: pyridoxal-phosphate dependent enzyme [Candidatus Bathyarchaeia archaeon]|jgi:threonine synthase